VTGTNYTTEQVIAARKNAYNTQLWRTVQALKSSKPLADAGKIFTVSLQDDTLVLGNAA
jgi:hypothetical protein